jgi:hypothetical protein
VAAVMVGALFVGRGPVHTGVAGVETAIEIPTVK